MNWRPRMGSEAFANKNSIRKPIRKWIGDPEPILKHFLLRAQLNNRWKMHWRPRKDSLAYSNKNSIKNKQKIVLETQ